MKTVAGIDMGTQSMKVVLYDYENKKTVESSSCPIDLISENDGTREQKTEWYKNAMEVCFCTICLLPNSNINEKQINQT